jgi:hypothetical protein
MHSLSSFREKSCVVNSVMIFLPLSPYLDQVFRAQGRFEEMNLHTGLVSNENGKNRKNPPGQRNFIFLLLVFCEPIICSATMPERVIHKPRPT